MVKAICIAVLGFCSFSSMLAQSESEKKIFDHLDISLTAGTTGLGIEASMPVGEYVHIRAGYSFFPHLESTSSFTIASQAELDVKPVYDKQTGHRVDKLGKMLDMMTNMTGIEADDKIDMILRPTMQQAKLLVDVSPFSNKRWHLTAGVFIGPKEIGRAYNTTEDESTLMAVCMFNNIYNKVLNEEPVFEYGDMSAEFPPQVNEKLLSNGIMCVHVGDFKGQMDENGKPVPYMMVPDNQGMVKLTAKASIIRPYLGFGYTSYISNDQKWRISLDAGVMFWGGRPHLEMHDGTCLMHDVENIKGKVGRKVSMAKCFPVFPLLEFRISRRIF